MPRSLWVGFPDDVVDTQLLSVVLLSVAAEIRLDVAHILSGSDYPEHRANPSDVLVLSKTQHGAFDRELFTIDQDYRLRVNPEFETESDVLQGTVINRKGDWISIPDESLEP